MIKKCLVISSLILLFIATGCDTINQLYGLEPVEEGEFISLDDIKVDDTPPAPPEETPTEETPEESTEETSEEETETPEEGTETPEEGVEETPEEIIEEPVEEIPEEVKENAKVLIVEEKETVSLQPSVADPDEDSITITYTTPLDENGKWETTYGDEGEYTITVTASDGQLSTAQDVLIIVNKKEETPTIDESAPDGSNVNTAEDEQIAFSVKASDLNNDALSYLWKLDGEDVDTTTEYTYDVDFDAAGDHDITITVSDGNSEATKSWSISVTNVNRKPSLASLSDITVKETEIVTIAPSAEDPDGDTIVFSVDSANLVQVGDSFGWETSYDDAGSYVVTVTASDGTDEVSQEVTITVENVNRAPVIDDIVLG